MHKQNGNTLSIIVITILVLAVVVLLGYIFIHTLAARKETDETTQVESGTDKEVTQPAEEESSLLVNEWGIRVKLTNHDKVSYTITPSVTTEQETPYDTLGLHILSSALVDTSCTEPGVDLYRQTVEPTFAYTKIGEYYYYVTGSPSVCSDSVADIQLQRSIIEELKPGALSVLN